MEKMTKTFLTGFIVFFILIAAVGGLFYYSHFAKTDPTLYGLNPLMKSASPLVSGDPKFEPIPENVRENYSSGNYNLSSATFDFKSENPFKASRRIKSESSVAVYGTVKEIRPPIRIGKSVSTPIIFQVDHTVKGNVSDEITVYIAGGYTETHGYWEEGNYMLKPWDFAVGEEYLLYLMSEPYGGVSFDNNSYWAVYKGVFIIDS